MRSRAAVLLVALCLGGAVLIDVCDRVFDCGCRSLWNGAASDCYIHDPVGGTNAAGDELAVTRLRSSLLERLFSHSLRAHKRDDLHGASAQRDRCVLSAVW